jgi:hypothetical protein
MTTKEGYLFVDHSASPGLPEDVARASGYDPKLAGEGKKFEAATLTCSHCKSSVVKNPLRTRERATCIKCGHHYVCDLCAANMRLADYDHLPFEKLVDLHMEGRAPTIIRMNELGSPPQLIMPTQSLTL